MADVFVSYKREDQEQKGRVIPIVRGLEAEGFDVFYDVEIPPGSTWEQVLQNKINQSKCVLVLWSHSSVDSDWVKEEAEIAKMAGKIIPVFLDPVNAPFGFGRIEGANLVGWDGDMTNREWQNLVAAVKSKVGSGSGERRPEVTSVPMPVNRRQGNSGNGGFGKIALIALLLAVLGVGGFYGFQMYTKQSSSSSHGDIDVVDRVKERERIAFEKAKSLNTIEGWEAFIKAYPTSGYLKDARDQLNHLRELARRNGDDPVIVTGVPVPSVTRTPVIRDATPVLKEDCLRYTGAYKLKVSDDGQLAQIVDSSGRGTPLAARGSTAEKEMQSALNIINHYELVYQCFVDRPDAPMKYWKTADGKLPSGTISGEDCLPFKNSTLEVKLRGGMYYVFSSGSSMFRFDTKESAELAVGILKGYGAGAVCYVGRPDPSMIYLKK